MGSTTKPLGGIAALTLGVASLSGAAPTLPDDGVAVPLLEDRSTYEENVEWVGDFKSVTHTLKIITPIEYSLPEELLPGLERGFVAFVVFHSSNTINVGWSNNAAADRALRLISCSTQSGDKPSSRGYKEWSFVSVDGVSAI